MKRARQVGRGVVGRGPLAILLFVLLLAAACGGQTQDTAAEDGTTDAADEPAEDAGGDEDISIVMIPGTAGDEFYYTNSLGAEDAAEELGVDLNVQFPSRFDPEIQTQVLNAAIARNPDAIIIAPTDSQAMIAPLKAAADAGIAIVLFDTTLEDTSFVESVVQIDDVEAGRQIARSLEDLTGGEGTMLFISVAPGISTTDRWIEGFQEVMGENDAVEVLDIQYSDNEETKAAQIMQTTLQRHPDLAGAFLGNLVSARGAISGLRAAGAVGNVRTVSFDGTPPQIEDLRNGEIDALVSTPAREYGQIAVEMAVAAIRGEPVEEEITLDTCILTAENVDDPDVAQCIYQPLE